MSLPANRYVILGAGRQGTAAAYDLARLGNAARIDGDATFIRNGKLVSVPTFTELETVDFHPLGALEAFVMAELGRRGIPHTVRWEASTR